MAFAQLIDIFLLLFVYFFTYFCLELPVTLSHSENTPERLECLVGKPVVLEIKVSQPTAEVKWLLNGKEIKESSNITITEDKTIRRLTISSPLVEDSGKYTCDAIDDQIDFQVKVSGKSQKSFYNGSFQPFH